jgi:hypothetical protein
VFGDKTVNNLLKKCWILHGSKTLQYEMLSFTCLVFFVHKTNLICYDDIKYGFSK